MEKPRVRARESDTRGGSHSSHVTETRVAFRGSRRAPARGSGRGRGGGVPPCVPRLLPLPEAPGTGPSTNYDDAKSQAK